MHCSGCKTCPIYSDRCPDRSFCPVGVEGSGDIAVVGDVPSGADTVEGRPFVGTEGEELQRALELVGWERSDLRLTNAIACTAPGIKFENYLARISKRNIARKKKKQKAWPTPMVACRERLLEELKGCTKIVVLGGWLLLLCGGVR